MRVVTRALPALIGLAAASACRQTPPEQNMAIENSAAPTEIEALPPDESVATPANELGGGDTANADEPANGH